MARIPEVSSDSTQLCTMSSTESYALNYSLAEPQLLAALREETERSNPRAQMLSGPLQGALLTLLTRLLRPKKVLEIGTFTGYSALCFAEGLPEESELHTIELDESLREIATRYFDASPHRHKIIQHFGRAQEVIPTLAGPFDLVFLDADKKGYVNYFNTVLPMMPSGGVILADNVLFHGEVLLPEDQQPPIARAIHQFNQHIATDPRVECVILPVRDGLSLIRKR